VTEKLHEDKIFKMKYIEEKYNFVYVWFHFRGDKISTWNHCSFRLQTWFLCSTFFFVEKLCSTLL